VPHVLEVDSLTVKYHGSSQAAVVGASLSIAPGERVALVGESGSGKSTLALALGGFLDPAESTTTAERMDFLGDRLVHSRAFGLPRRHHGISMIFQDAMSSLDPVWTVGSQLLTVLRATGLSRRDAVAEAHEWLRRVGLPDVRRVLRARPGELSGGMRQRIMVAIALSSQPRLLIADEPTSALDASLSRETMELLVGLTRESDAALLVITHDILLSSAYTDKLLVMYRGRIVEELRADGLDRAEHPYTIGLLRSVPTLEHRHVHRLPTLTTGAPR
jgi:ABC-type dipeptide/oligopeptide/nickel transport system ATPase component